MKKINENDRMSFNGYCESAKIQAVIKASEFAESIKLDELKTQGRLRRVNSEIDLIYEERKVLDRPLYLLYVCNLAALFELFERMNYLHNPEEMAKLQQAIFLVEKYRRLGLLMIETIAMEDVENYNARQLSLKAMGKKNSSKKTLLQKQDAQPLDVIQTSLKSRTKPIRKPAKEIVTFGCKVAKAYLYEELQLMNNEFHILDPRTSLDTLIHVFTCEDWTKNTEIVYLRCHTNEFKCIIDTIKHLFKHLNYSSIERSGLFISNFGTVIKASNLSSSNYQKTPSREKIEKILL